MTKGYPPQHCDSCTRKMGGLHRVDGVAHLGWLCERCRDMVSAGVALGRRMGGLPTLPPAAIMPPRY